MRLFEQTSILRERLESHSLYQVLDLLGKPQLLGMFRRSMKYRSRITTELIRQIETLAHTHHIATETDLAHLEVKLRMLKVELAVLKRSTEIDQE